MNRRNFNTRIALGLLIAIASKFVDLNTEDRNPNIAQAQNINSWNSSNTITYYVSPSGNDKNVGNEANPFASLTRARNAIRELKQQNSGKLLQPVSVFLRSGYYHLKEPLHFTPQDSGDKNTPITYQSYPQETAVISSGKVISGWQKSQLNGQTVWTVNLPEVSAGKWYFQQLWVNKERRIRSRYPDQGYFKIKTVVKTENWQEGQDSFHYDPQDIPPQIAKKVKKLVVLHHWVESHLLIKEIDTLNHKIQFHNKSLFRLAPGDLYYLTDSKAILTTPGEWYLDRDSGKLSYLPLPGETIENTTVIAPQFKHLTFLHGKPSNNQYVQYLNFENLTFSHTDWEVKAEEQDYARNALGVLGAVIARGIRYCSWNNCNFEHIGNHAIELFKGCQYNSISNCVMFDLGGSGIKIGERQIKRQSVSPGEITHSNSITDNHIYNGGKFFHSSPALRTILSHHNLIARNHIHDFYYMGIAVLGVWGFKPTNAHHNTIEDNYVHHIGQLATENSPILSDLAGIYILGNQPETIIRGNIVTDVSASRYGGWGIYLDEGSSSIVVENNIVSRTTHGGFMQHYGRDNLIRNNIFAFGKKAQLHRSPRDLKFSRQLKHNCFRCENNIFYWEDGNFFGGIKNNPQTDVVFDFNIYWNREQQPIKMANLSWKQWQNQQDKNSIIADPLFVNPKEGDFRLQSNSPAIRLGFNPNSIPLAGSITSR